jgi:hypothetical protein
MTQLSTPPVVAATVPSAATRRLAGGLALGHVVLLLGAFAVEGVSAAEHGTSPTKLVQVYDGAPLGRTLLAGYVESLSFFVLAAAVVVIAHLFSRRTTGGRLAAQAFVVFGVCYIAATLASGFPAGAAALYAAHHGVDAGSIAMVNDIRNYGFVLQIALSVAMALALGIAALQERLHVRWVGWGGVVLGVLGLVLVPVAHNGVSMVWMIWWVGLGLVLLRQTSPQE